ncbi:hypothetical protein QOT17_000761 [Balamuthia mandrillaris]
MEEPLPEEGEEEEEEEVGHLLIDEEEQEPPPPTSSLKSGAGGNASRRKRKTPLSRTMPDGLVEDSSSRSPKKLRLEDGTLRVKGRCMAPTEALAQPSLYSLARLWLDNMTASIATQDQEGSSNSDSAKAMRRIKLPRPAPHTKYSLARGPPPRPPHTSQDFDVHLYYYYLMSLALFSSSSRFYPLQSSLSLSLSLSFSSLGPLQRLINPSNGPSIEALQKGHRDYAHVLRTWFNNQHLHRLNRYKARLAKLLPQPLEGVQHHQGRDGRDSPT